MFSPDIWMWIACGLSAATFLLHMIPGAKANVPPLLASDMKPQPKFTNYYCWEIVSITILALAVFFGLAALYPTAWELGLAATLLSGSFALLSLFVAYKGKVSIWLLPQWIFFGVICIAGALAFL